MARPCKSGLDYFSFDVDFFEDEKITAIFVEYGIKGEIIAIRLLCAIYRNGYYAKWDTPLKMKIAKSSGLEPDLIDEIVNRLVNWDFFDKTLFDTAGILTSRGIQKRYVESTKRRGDNTITDYCLVNVYNNPDNCNNNSINVCNNSDKDDLKMEQKCEPNHSGLHNINHSKSINVYNNPINVCKNSVNVDNNSKNVYNNQQSKGKESKVNKSKEEVRGSELNDRDIVKTKNSDPPSQLFLSQFESEYPNIDHEKEFQKCLDYYTSRNKKIENWAPLYHNWLKKDFPKIMKPIQKKPIIEYPPESEQATPEQIHEQIEKAKEILAKKSKNVTGEKQ